MCIRDRVSDILNILKHQVPFLCKLLMPSRKSITGIILYTQNNSPWIWYNCWNLMIVCMTHHFSHSDSKIGKFFSRSIHNGWCFSFFCISKWIWEKIFESIDGISRFYWSLVSVCSYDRKRIFNTLKDKPKVVFSLEPFWVFHVTCLLYTSRCV